MQFAPGLPPSDCEITRVLAHDIYKTLSRKHSKKNPEKTKERKAMMKHAKRSIPTELSSNYTRIMKLII